MNEQGNLFDSAQPLTVGKADLPPMERFQAAMVCSAIGDALGWPTELLHEAGGRKPSFALPIRDFVKWEKFVGGRWWGYLDQIAPGEYSDDTQLTLAVARSISSAGDFEPERFSYTEFPLWLHYERGGGRSIKTAARALIRPKADWLHNFYKQGPLDYRRAGANGAAMRNLPIGLVSCMNEARLVRDSFFNAIISHGHPRAILGAILFGLAVRHAVTDQDCNPFAVVQYLQDALESIDTHLWGDQRISQWVEAWETIGKGRKTSFKQSFAEARAEAHRYLAAISDFLAKPVQDYYRFVGAVNPESRGSGLATTCTAVYLFLRFQNTPAEALYGAANQLGSDTDTIAAFVGGLLGARFGNDVVPRHLWEKIQDRDYLLKIGAYLHAIASGKAGEHISADTPLDRKDAYLRILAWEIGLHEMFWDAIDIGGVVVHPTLGRGVVNGKDIRPGGRRGFIAKLIRISFECGQSCVFHSWVKDGEKVAGSLAREIERALRQ